MIVYGVCVYITNTKDNCLILRSAPDFITEIDIFVTLKSHHNLIVVTTSWRWLASPHQEHLLKDLFQSYDLVNNE